MLTMPHRDWRDGASNRLLAEIDRYLNDGKAAVGVLVKADEVKAVTAKLTELGGMAAESYEVSEEVIEEAVAAAEEKPDVAAEGEPVSQE